ncbi:MAG: hypothetical protein ABJE66_05420 [Deltaproteobacteria bacterium]
MVMTSHSADLQTEVGVDFDCRACGTHGRAIVLADGIGLSTTIGSLDREAARTAALQEAQADAKHQAKVTMRLVRCPRCKRRSAVPLVVFAASTAIGTLMIGALALVAFLRGGVFGIAFTALFGLVAIGFAGQRLTRLTRANAFVRRWELLEPVLPAATARALPPAAPRVEDDASPRLLR